MKDLILLEVLREIDNVARDGLSKYTPEEWLAYFKETLENEDKENIGEAIIFGIKNMPLHKEPDFCLHLLFSAEWVVRMGIVEYPGVFFKWDVLNDYFDKNPTPEKLDNINWDLLKFSLAKKHPDFLPTEEQRGKLGFYFNRPEALSVIKNWEALKLKRDYAPDCEVKKIKRAL